LLRRFVVGQGIDALWNIELARHVPSKSSQNRIGPRGIRHVRQRLAAQSMTNLAQRCTDSSKRPLSRDLKIRFSATKYSFAAAVLVYRPGDVGKDSCPVH